MLITLKSIVCKPINSDSKFYMVRYWLHCNVDIDLLESHLVSI